MGQSVQENIWVSQYRKMYGSVSIGKCMVRSVLENVWVVRYSQYSMGQSV